MGDVLQGKTEIDAVSAELISSMTQMYLVQEAKLLPTVLDFSALAGPGMDKIKIPLAGGFTVGDKTENTAVEAQSLTYSTDDLALDKHKVVQVLVERYASLQSQVNMLQDMSMRAGKGLAAKLDSDIYDALVATSASAPDHRVAYAAGSATTEADLTNARKLLNVQNVPLEDRFYGINPADEKAILGIANFIQSERYGSSLPIVKGEIGMAYGFRIIMHNAFTYNVAWHKAHVAVAIQQGLRFLSQLDLANIADRYSFDQVYGVKTLQAGIMGVKVGSAS